MKKHIPNVILIFLLAVISILVIFAKGVITLPEKGDASSNGNIDTIVPPLEKPDVPETPQKYPIPSQKDEFYNFNQSLANVETYCGFITNHSETFVIYIQDKNLKISKIDKNLNILKEKIIHKSGKYLTSKLTLDGMLIAFTDGSNTYLQCIDFELKESGDTLTLPKCNVVKIFSYSESYMAILDTQIYIISQNVVLNSKSIPDTVSIDEVVMEYNCYLILTTKIDSYCMIKLTFNLEEIFCKEVKGKQIADFKIISEKAQSYYIIAERFKENFEIIKLDKTFDCIATTNLGSGKGLALTVLDNSIIISLYGTSSRLLYMDFSLNFNSSNNEHLKDCSGILQSQIYLNNSYLLLKTSTNSVLVSLSSKDFVKKYTFESSVKINFVINTNSTISIISQVGTNIKILNLNI